MNNLEDWVSLAEAATRIPAVKPGKRTGSRTVKEMAKRAGLELRKRGPFYFVHWPSLVELFEPVAVPTPRVKVARRTLAQQRDWERRARAVGL